MSALRDMLVAATDLIGEGGRLSVITYHSLEDRIVKNVMKAGNPDGKIEEDLYGRVDSPFRLVNNKVILPSAEEQERNPRSRSAKLRIAEKAGSLRKSRSPEVQKSGRCWEVRKSRSPVITISGDWKS